MAALRTEAERLEQAMRTLIYPILSISPELTIAIFKACVNQDPKHGPLALSHVCSQWRQAALATPELWTNIQSTMELRVWFGRTGTCLLNADVTIRSSGDLATLEDYLFDHPSRWEMLTLRMEHTAFPRVTRYSLPCFLPCLRGLYVNQGHMLYPSAEHLEVAPSLMAAYAPCLVELRMKYIAHVLGAQMAIFTYLTTLCIAGDDAECRAFLNLAPNLQSLTISSPPPEQEGQVVSPLVMSQLRTVIILDGYPGFLDHLITPELEHLQFELDFAVSPVAVKSLVSRSACTRSLRVLDMSVGEANQDHEFTFITRFFDLMGTDLANLERLTLREPLENSLDPLFYRMGHPGDQDAYTAILPALKSLTLINVGYLAISTVSSMAAMLETRTTDVPEIAKLESFRFSIEADAWNPIDQATIDDALTQVRSFRDRGVLDIQVYTASPRFTNVWELRECLNRRCKP
ncbi:hypothetical protein FB45DRAFT_1017887 [Roridomyces roridus]|uniref:F-box domain-containing protein n=1 Tax=Roridomyces roridus TaxID=1738132 RepID=A0AAD7CM19_9AGAR|nr:hypothetical protein FB45DRAFT_1017887 [Roridomyces roridus]